MTELTREDLALFDKLMLKVDLLAAKRAFEIADKIEKAAGDRLAELGAKQRGIRGWYDRASYEMDSDGISFRDREGDHCGLQLTFEQLLATDEELEGLGREYADREWARRIEAERRAKAEQTRRELAELARLQAKHGA